MAGEQIARLRRLPPLLRLEDGCCPLRATARGGAFRGHRSQPIAIRPRSSVSARVTAKLPRPRPAEVGSPTTSSASRCRPTRTLRIAPLVLHSRQAPAENAGSSQYRNQCRFSFRTHARRSRGHYCLASVPESGGRDPPRVHESPLAPHHATTPAANESETKHRAKTGTVAYRSTLAAARARLSAGPSKSRCANARASASPRK